MDPFDYSIQPRSFGGYGLGANPPAIQMPSKIKSTYSSGAGKFTPSDGSDMWAQIGGAALGALGSYFTGRQQRKMQEQELGLQRERMRFEKQQYADQMAQLRARQEYMRPVMDEYRAGTGRFATPDRGLTAASPRGGMGNMSNAEDILERVRRRQQEGG